MDCLRHAQPPSQCGRTSNTCRNGANATANVEKPPTHVMVVQNVRSTTKISLGTPRSSESNQGCVETCMTPSKCHQHLRFALPQGNHPHGGAKTSNTCQDGSKCPINHRNLNGCPKVVRIQSGCVETCVMTPTCMFSPATKEIMPTLAVCPPQGNCPRGGEKTSNTCHDGSQCPINHRDLSACPEIVRIQSKVCGNPAW